MTLDALSTESFDKVSRVEVLFHLEAMGTDTSR